MEIHCRGDASPAHREHVVGSLFGPHRPPVDVDFSRACTESALPEACEDSRWFTDDCEAIAVSLRLSTACEDDRKKALGQRRWEPVV